MAEKTNKTRVISSQLKNIAHMLLIFELVFGLSGSVSASCQEVEYCSWAPVSCEGGGEICGWLFYCDYYPDAPAGCLAYDTSYVAVGEQGASTTNPPDPNQTPTGSPPWRYDDELYDLLPFVNNGDTIVVVDTVNPSDDDSIFFAALFMKSAIGFIGDVISLYNRSVRNG